MGTPAVRRLDKNHDMTFGGSMRNVATGSESTQQRIRCELLYMKGEWFIDTDGGVPWVVPDGSDTQAILGVRPDARYAEAVLKEAILSIDGVATLDTFEIVFDKTKRKLTVSCTGTTADGDAFQITDCGP